MAFFVRLLAQARGTVCRPALRQNKKRNKKQGQVDYILMGFLHALSIIPRMLGRQAVSAFGRKRLRISDDSHVLIALPFQACLVVLLATHIAGPHRLRRQPGIGKIGVAVRTILLAFCDILLTDLCLFIGRTAMARKQNPKSQHA